MQVSSQRKCDVLPRALSFTPTAIQVSSRLYALCTSAPTWSLDHSEATENSEKSFFYLLWMLYCSSLSEDALTAEAKLKLAMDALLQQQVRKSTYHTSSNSLSSKEGDGQAASAKLRSQDFKR
eukprot:TRINITY_DN1702_c0_g1_i3.p3 TRINITY_DN1702_c0_g1~~TRINITY_DN1702_c0_g1_i3.p3  ORF type:complete len:123 (-),score=6.13 TRINITY_DN1702_c0_g1_i3:989-1357(-)